ncbi:MAG TPA: serine/threonine-protein kinase, partial [Longimicrobiaceae bacterium]|nr:serine/threonine-protein kinase [Longimicrobiaceae bacterium]
MTDPHWTRISELVARALELPASERAAFVAREADEERVREEVLSLVEAAASEEDVLGRLAAQIDWSVPDPAEPGQLMSGRRIGPWRLLHMLGHGGMGDVYAAERADGAFEQRVALKLLRATLVDPHGRDRFTAERQILARLNHPAIARLLDGGILDDGVPWFAMEYVEGVPITEACDAAAMDAAERVELFVRVCEAVDYAHRKLVVHRDLKPSNVLVTAEGRVKLIDFGVAELRAAEGRETVDAHPVTPAYAAPEQLRGEPTGTATDVWSLGVLLHELLTGHRPRPGDLPPDTGAGRDIDAILRKALDPDPEGRYPGAAELAEDLRRHRDRLPVRARRATPGYQVGCFVRRRRAGVAAAALVALLTTALVGQAIQSGVRARADAERLALERNKAEATSEFLLGIFTLADQDEADGETISARKLLDEGARRIGEDLDESPGVRASMLHTLGRAYASLGLYERAEALLSQALALRRERDAGNRRELAETLRDLGRVRLARDASGRAQTALLEALGLLRDLGEEAGAADTLFALGEVAHQQGRLERGWERIEEAVDISRRIGRTETPEYASALLSLASARRSPQALELAEEAVEVHRRVYGEDHPLVGEALIKVGDAAADAGRLAAAERRFRQELRIVEERASGSDRHASALTALGRILIRQGRLAESVEVLERAVTIGGERPGSV